jgi:hypothetical protein
VGGEAHASFVPRWVSKLRARFTPEKASTGPAKSMREIFLPANGRSLKPRG